MAQRSRFKRWGYAAIRVAARLVGVALFHVRCRDRRRVPASGGVLVCCNHQSALDPLVVGLACDRRLNYLARRSLFRFTLFRWLIEYLDAIPLDRHGLGVEGLKETLRRLKRGEMVLIFPEGTRTCDGEMRSLRPGFGLLARRSGATLLPMALDGTFEAWPRHARYPGLATLQIQFGEPLPPETIAQWDDERLTAEVESRMRGCLARARAARHRFEGRRPQTGDGQ